MNQMIESSVYNTLLKTYDILSEVGLAKQMHRDPDTGAMDVDGAIMRACGAKNITILVADINTVLPPASIARYTEALWQLDKLVPEGDVVSWADQEEITQEDVLLLIQSALQALTYP